MPELFASPLVGAVVVLCLFLVARWAGRAVRTALTRRRDY